MKQKSPQKLFVCLLKNSHGDEEIKKGIPDTSKHGQYMTDLWQKGTFWAGGPADAQTAIQIYSVDSLDEAIKAQRNAPMYVNGILYEDKYLEWTPVHWPPPPAADIDPSTGKRIKS